jgi:hypothetical protein
MLASYLLKKFCFIEAVEEVGLDSVFIKLGFVVSPEENRYFDFGLGSSCGVKERG